MNYYTLDTETNVICGPFTAPQLLEMRETSALSDATPAAVEGAASWGVLGDLLPVLHEDFDREVHAVLENGPPTSAELLKLLKEDGDFPRPRQKMSHVSVRVQN
jgi:hypothetical protein